MSFWSRLFGDKGKQDTEIIGNLTTTKSYVTMGKNMFCPREYSYPRNLDVKIPAFKNDYAKTLFLNTVEVSPVLEKRQYNPFLVYECGIKDCAAYHKKMISEGYLAEANPIQKLSLLSLQQLKDICQEMGISCTGTKNKLSEKIINKGIAPNSYFNNTVYSLTEQGKVFVKEHEYYIKMRKLDCGELWQKYDTLHKANETFCDTMWRLIHNERFDRATCGRFMYRTLYYLLDTESPLRRREALDMLLRVLYIDLSGSSHCDFLFEWVEHGETDAEGKKWVKNELYTRYTSLTLIPEIIGKIAGYKDVYEEGMIDTLYNDMKLPIQICDNSLCKEIVDSIFFGKLRTNEESFKQKLKFEYQRYIEQNYPQKFLKRWY